MCFIYCIRDVFYILYSRCVFSPSTDAGCWVKGTSQIKVVGAKAKAVLKNLNLCDGIQCYTVCDVLYEVICCSGDSVTAC